MMPQWQLNARFRRRQSWSVCQNRCFSCSKCLIKVSFFSSHFTQWFDQLLFIVFDIIKWLTTLFWIFLISPAMETLKLIKVFVVNGLYGAFSYLKQSCCDILPVLSFFCITYSILYLFIRFQEIKYSTGTVFDMFDSKQHLAACEKWLNFGEKIIIITWPFLVI